jgi:hypothetical protein
MYRLDWLEKHQQFNLSAIASGTGGFVIIGEFTDNNSCFSVSSAGDVNGDGLAPCALSNGIWVDYCVVFFTEDDIGSSCFFSSP